MKRFEIWFSKFPFSGKCVIRPSLFRFYLSASPGERKINFISIFLLLLLYIALHLAQAKMGLDLLLNLSPVLVKVIAVVYLLVNLSASSVQTYLLIRVFVFLSTHKRKYPRPRDYTDYGSYTTKESLVSSIFTLLGQFIFIVFYLIYRC